LHTQIVSTEDGGKYKSIDYVRDVTFENGRRVRFATIPADETDEAIRRLISAWHDAQNRSDINQLLLIPCFILDFLCIHPFATGNLRISWLLSALLLYKAGFDAARYVPAGPLPKYPIGYFYALADSTARWNSERNNYFPFVGYFINSILERQKSKRERIENFILSNRQPVTKAVILRALTDISQSTIELVLSEMLSGGMIEKIGGGRGTTYRVR
jgi:Fic family protein